MARTDDDAESFSGEIELLPAQDAELFDREHELLYVIGGRGSGKSTVNYLHFFLRSEKCVDQVYALFANTDSQLQSAIIAPITEQLDRAGIKHVYESKAPAAWRARWRREGIVVPARRLRNTKLWIWEDGTHIFTGTLVGNSYTRVKSLDLAMALIEEATEPGITRTAIATIVGAVRCGLGKRGPDGESECRRRGHFHQTIVKGNVPLNNPRHWVFKEVERLQRAEEKRRIEGSRPYFRLISSSTFDNPHTGEEYVDRMRGALDEETFREQTSGSLTRNRAATSYYAFSERNILSTLRYDPARPLHVWSDFNVRPAASGWGHDLRYDEVPSVEHAPGMHYFGIIGELFSGAEPMTTEQVAYALLEDPTKDLAPRESRCNDCGCAMEQHTELDASSGWLCRRCAYTTPAEFRERFNAPEFCSGQPASIEERTKIAKPGRMIHAPANWRGLFHHQADIYVYGDATGKASHADAMRDGGSRAILRDILTANLGDRVHMRFKEANPSIVRRVLAVNRGFRNARGFASDFVAPWCEAHIADFREVVPDENGEPLKVPKKESNTDDYWLRTDASDGWGYHVDFRWPARIPSAGLPSDVDDERADGTYGPFARLG